MSSSRRSGQDRGPPRIATVPPSRDCPDDPRQQTAALRGNPPSPLTERFDWPDDAKPGRHRRSAPRPAGGTPTPRLETRLDPEPAGEGDPPTTRRAPAAPGKHTNTLRARRQASLQACLPARRNRLEPSQSLADARPGWPTDSGTKANREEQDAPEKIPRTPRAKRSKEPAQVAARDAWPTASSTPAHARPVQRKRSRNRVAMIPESASGSEDRPRLSPANPDSSKPSTASRSSSFK